MDHPSFAPVGLVFDIRHVANYIDGGPPLGSMLILFLFRLTESHLDVAADC